MPTTPRTWIAPVGLLAAGAVAGAVLAGTFSASAATPSPTPSADSQDSRPHQDGTALTGDAKSKAEAAALAKYPGTVQDSVQESDGTYEVHILKSDGTRVSVEVNKDFSVKGLETHQGRGGPRGRMHGTPLTGDVKTKAEAAALAKYPGTVQDSEEEDGVYEVHLLKADGTRLSVEVSKAFVVTGLETHQGHGGDVRR